MATSDRTRVAGASAAQARQLGTAVLDPSTRAIIRERVLEVVTARERFEPARWGFYDATKRGFDIVLSLSAVLLSLPVMLLIAAMITIDSRGPVFFRQERLGKNAKPFGMLKFRTMCSTHEDVTGELAAQNESTGPLFKMRSDPRITRAGRLLRRFSLDELPQLFNVLAGEMSIVGPRPPLPRELPGYEGIQLRRLLVLPGLTGLWQVSGRSDLSFDEMVELDYKYIEKRSLLLDLRIVLKTLPCVLLGRGAY
ncbi:MAG TPA: sugar transferase [Dehalococcoidia bacterium]|nr:sugar transferase [Dehalococcoidia bacterium]